MAEELQKYPGFYEKNDIIRDRAGGKCLENSWELFNSIFMNNKGLNYTLGVRTFFFTTFAKKFII